MGSRGAGSPGAGPAGAGPPGDRDDADLRRDLHDTLGPVLSALALRVSTIRDHLERDDPGHAARARDLAAQLEDEIDDVIAQVRHVLHDRGGADRVHLSTRLAARVQMFNQARGSAWITLDTRGPIDALPRQAQQALLLVVSEALTNVVRHSGAAECVVEVHRDDDAVHVRVFDDGLHRDPVGPGAGVGVRSMRLRIERLGGSLAVHPRPGGGTEVVASIPGGPAPGR